ncbi:Ribonuclease HI [Dehalogenimonas alkenigignens]|uniref:Ribonuclease HI n=1 Tax=Dehalogenimonas alkenigignens TaxID=1217799 RepID=A0A0W0GKY7_9CHLR|nr:ribonuclease HI family protein [Dehalogenimonas alkenigignens]KTB49222.1 Ribonuclease HI [Dehalogenimonas alkenigignens]
MTYLIANTDAACRGNPGESAIGILIRTSTGQVVKTVSRAIGRMTNNQAEYHAIISALEEASKLGAEELTLIADSELAVKQLTGRYRVKNPGLEPLYAKVKILESKFKKVTYRHVPRERNSDADGLANKAFKS